MKRLLAQVALLLYLAVAASAQGKENAERLPNIIIINADDIGYGDISFNGATKVKTPRIDAFFREGKHFTDAHSASAVCTPSRYALMTGEYPFRKNLWGPNGHQKIIDDGQLTLASLLKEKGYATACFGKWHIGMKGNDYNKPLRNGPVDVGFDYFYGIHSNHSHPPYVYFENDTVVGLEKDDPIIFKRNKDPRKANTELIREKFHPHRFVGGDKAHGMLKHDQLGTNLTNRAIEWMKQHKDGPFFLYLPTINIHHPFTPAPQFKGTSRAGVYGDFIHELDWIVGRVLDALDAMDVAGNTLVVFTSDNGGMLNIGGQEAWQMGHRMNAHLLGFKFGAWEGGHRVPFAVRWPGHVTPGSKSSQIIGNVDMLATLADIVKRPLKAGEARDSVSLISIFTKDDEQPVRNHLLIAPNKRKCMTVRKGKWLYINGQSSGGWKGKPGAHCFGGIAAATYAGKKNSDFSDGKLHPNAPKAQLYDLEKDISQLHNVIRQHPGVVKVMQAILEAENFSVPAIEFEQAGKK